MSPNLILEVTDADDQVHQHNQKSDKAKQKSGIGASLSSNKTKLAKVSGNLLYLKFFCFGLYHKVTGSMVLTFPG